MPDGGRSSKETAIIAACALLAAIVLGIILVLERFGRCDRQFALIEAWAIGSLQAGVATMAKWEGDEVADFVIPRFVERLAIFHR